MATGEASFWLMGVSLPITNVSWGVHSRGKSARKCQNISKLWVNRLRRFGANLLRIEAVVSICPCRLWWWKSSWILTTYPLQGEWWWPEEAHRPCPWRRDWPSSEKDWRENSPVWHCKAFLWEPEEQYPEQSRAVFAKSNVPLGKMKYTRVLCKRVASCSFLFCR